MSIVQQLLDRKKSGPGSVEVSLDGGDQSLIVPVKYPSASDQSVFAGYLASVDLDVKGAQAREQEIEMSKKAIRLCVAGDEEMGDEELMILLTESGGFMGVLVQRCLQLLGAGVGVAQSKVVKGGKRRGR